VTPIDDAARARTPRMAGTDRRQTVEEFEYIPALRETMQGER
jgi:hypothetical protein